MRIPSPDRPFAYPDQQFRVGIWPAEWVSGPFDYTPAVYAYRRKFRVESPAKVRVHISADERYELFLNGERLGRGPERGDARNWFFESYELDLPAGEHTLVARCWWLGSPHHTTGPAAQDWSNGQAPYAQMTIRHGFLCAAEAPFDEVLSTGKAEWECLKLSGYAWLPKDVAWGTGCRVQVDGSAFSWGWEHGEGSGWQRAERAGQALDIHTRDGIAVWRLRPSMLPAMREETFAGGKVRHVQAIADEGACRKEPVLASQNLEAERPAWQALIEGQKPLTLPPGTRRRLIIDLDNYHCAYPEIVVSGGKGSRLRLHWAESLYSRLPGEREWIAGMPKDNRDAVEGKYFVGVGDVFLPDGGANRRFDTLWWEDGRYVELYVEVGSEPLTLEAIRYRDTHYPYLFASRFECSDPKLLDIVPIALRTLEMCSHETYMDCPYYEQLMYVGDTRLEVLVTHATCADDRLPRKAVFLFDESRIPSGLTYSRYPSNVPQFIPPFSLWWVCMTHDLAMWRPSADFVRGRLSGVRAVLEFFRQYVKDGLLAAPPGWNFFDWIGNLGDIPEGSVHSIYNLQLILALQAAADLETHYGDPDLAIRNAKLAAALGQKVVEAFWNEERGLLTDDLDGGHISEHAQALAVIAGILPDDKRAKVRAALLDHPSLVRTTIYFTHYLFEAYRLLGVVERLQTRLELWDQLKQNGLRTTIEHPEPSRSDCHAWGAHPVFHYYATILGIRPASPGFETVRIAPQLGRLASASGRMVHPKGFIEVSVAGGEAKVSLPPGVTGTLVWNGQERAIP